MINVDTFAPKKNGLRIVQNFYNIKEDKLFKVGIENIEQELSVSESLEKSISHYQNQFSKLEKEVTDVISKIDGTDNKGSYLAKVLLLSDQIDNHEGIGDYGQLADKLKVYKATLLNFVEQNRIKNTEIKKALFADLKVIVDEDNWKAINEVKEIHQKWVRVGKAIEADDAQLTADFNTLKDGFFDRRKEYVESQKDLHESRIQLYREIIIEIESINLSKDFLKRKSEIEKLVENWKSNGSIPKSVYDTLFKVYKASLDEYYNKLKPFSKKNTKEHFKEMLDGKKAVLSKLEAYISSTTAYDIKTINAFRTEWAKVGNVPGKVLASVGDKFYGSLEFLYEYTNVLRFHTLRNLPVENATLLKTIKRFIRENEQEIVQFQENQQQMTFQLSNESVTNLIGKRLSELQKKLKAKQRVLASLEKVG